MLIFFILQIDSVTNNSEGFFAQPNWLLQSILGAIIGILLPYLFRLIKNLYYFFSKESFWVGKWFVYHWSFYDEEPRLFKSTAEIKKAFLHRYSVKVTQSETNLVYSGTCRMGDNEMVMKFYSKNHEENFIIKFEKVIASKEKMYGLWLSIDHDRHIASGVQLFTRKALTDLEIEGEIIRGVAIESGKGIMKIDYQGNSK